MAIRSIISFLPRHISLYKFSLSMADHVYLAQLLLEILFIDGLDRNFHLPVMDLLTSILKYSCSIFFVLVFIIIAL